MKALDTLCGILPEAKKLIRKKVDDRIAAPSPLAFAHTLKPQPQTICVAPVLTKTEWDSLCGIGSYHSKLAALVKKLRKCLNRQSSVQ